MAQAITYAGEKLFATQAQLNQTLDIDTFIFANVPGQDPTTPIDRNEGLPPVSQRVHTQAVQQKGKINDNIVVYSTLLESIAGPFEFNWVGLYSSVHQKLISVQHIPTVNKTTTAGGAAGNTLNRNFGIEYSGIADITNITVDAQTWQLDFTARLQGIDKLHQQLAREMNGENWFIENGLQVYQRETANTFGIRSGVGYVSGVRVEVENEIIVAVNEYPRNIFLDVWFDGDASSTWSANHEISITNDNITDYTDSNGKQHYVLKLAVVSGGDEVSDLRNTKGLVTQISEIASRTNVLEGENEILTEEVERLYEVEVLDFNYAKPFRKLTDYDSDGEVWAYILTGQSVGGGGVGNDNTPEIKPAIYPNNIKMLSPQPVIDGLSQMGNTLIPLEEKSRVTIGASSMQGIYENKGVDCIFSGQAYGGQAYSAIKKGGSTGIYERCIEQVGYVLSASPNAVYKGVAIIHGEQDGINGNVNYANDLIEWANDFNTDIKAASNSTSNVPVFICQTSTGAGYGNNGGIGELTFPAPLEQLKAHINSNLINLVCSKYHLEYYDHSHLTNKGQVRLGEYYEKAMLAVANAEAWSPLRPSLIEVVGNKIIITFAGAVGGLVFDETLVNQTENQGFSYTDGSGNTITGVAINGSNQVEISVTGVGANAVVAYAYHNGSGGALNQVNGLGDRGNLRDSDPTKSKYSDDRLYNWCVIFREEI